MSLFKWYQVHLIIKNHDYEKFENAVGILIVLFEKFPNVLNTFEFLRIIRKLKTIVCILKKHIILPLFSSKFTFHQHIWTVLL